MRPSTARHPNRGSIHTRHERRFLHRIDGTTGLSDNDRKLRYYLLDHLGPVHGIPDVGTQSTPSIIYRGLDDGECNSDRVNEHDQPHL